MQQKVKTVLFRNFSDQIFSAVKPHKAKVGDREREIIDENCKWDGEPYHFEPGETRYMPDWKARHFAKHLTNRELVKKGMDADTSPKKPEDNPRFMELFNQAYIEDGSEEMSEFQAEDQVINKNKDLEIAKLKEENERLRREMLGGKDVEVEDKNERGAAQEEIERQKPAPKEEKSEIVTKIDDVDDEDEDEVPAGSEEAGFAGLNK